MHDFSTIGFDHGATESLSGTDDMTCFFSENSKREIAAKNVTQNDVALAVPLWLRSGSGEAALWQFL